MNSLKQKILVVDDERVVREGCRRILEAEGFDVFLADSGGIAMEIVSNPGVDLVLADLKMPGIGGMDLLFWLQKNHPSVPAIVITGLSDDGIQTKCEEAGAFKLLAKPFMSKEVLSAVKHAL